MSISLDVAPPPLVVESQPPPPDDGYIWTPGYWAYDDDGGEYYWVPGAWVQPPEVGYYWTPSYWGWDGNDYLFNNGYWGPTVGFYGGINYGYGYYGNGYGGGRWNSGHFEYNTAANNISGAHVRNTYTDSAVVHSQSSRVSFNGGRGGIQVHATPQQLAAAQSGHVPATAQQQSHFQSAMQTRSHGVKVAAKKAVTGNAPQSAGTSPYTGKNAESQNKEAGTMSAPAQREQQYSPETQPKPEERERAPMTENTPASASAQGQREEKPTQEIEHAPSTESHTMAPAETHVPQGPGPAAVHDKPAEAPAASHAPAQAPAASHPAAAPAGPAGAPSGGGGDKNGH